MLFCANSNYQCAFENLKLHNDLNLEGQGFRRPIRKVLFQLILWEILPFTIILGFYKTKFYK